MSELDVIVRNSVNKIQILKYNSDYAIGDIIFKKGKRWKYRIQKVKNDIKYKNTILQEYLNTNKKTTPNYFLLLKCIQNYNLKYDLPIPSKKEIVLHLRMGDAVMLDWYLNKNYIEQIKRIIKNNMIEKLTIVTCFSYGAWSKESLHLKQGAPDWGFTDKKQQKNELLFSKLLTNILKEINIPISIYSNEDIDKDICYCVLAKFYIKDHGGFDDLTEKLNKLYLTTIRNKNKLKN